MNSVADKLRERDATEAIANERVDFSYGLPDRAHVFDVALRLRLLQLVTAAGRQPEDSLHRLDDLGHRNSRRRPAQAKAPARTLRGFHQVQPCELRHSRLKDG